MSEHSSKNGPPERRIRSFVRRAGRMTPAQARAIETLAPRFVLDYTPDECELGEAFGRDAPRVLEIGYGNGDALIAQAGRLPDADFLGIEVHEPGVGHLLLGVEALGLTNIRVICHDAAEVIRDMLPAASFAAINIFFPDPWPKKRHHKRRLVQPALIERLARLQAPGGLLHLATDWMPYAEHMDEVMAASPGYQSLTDADVADEPLAWRPETRFERRGLRLGHAVRDLYFRRTG